MSRTRVVNLPSVVHTRKYRKLRLSENSVITCSSRYLGVSKAKPYYGTQRPFANLKNMLSG